MQHFKGLVKPYVLWSFLLIALPLVLVVLYSVTTGDNSLITIHFTLDNFKKICDAKLDFTIGSALDIFGGHLSYQEIAAKYNE